MTSNKPKEIFSDDEDENECRLSCSLRWLITKAYPHGSLPSYLPHSHFFQLEDDERFLSPDIALVLLSGDLYIRAFQQITNQQDQFITYEDLIEYFAQQQKIDIDLNALKHDDPLNANAHLDLIDHLIKLYGKMNIDTTILSHRFEKLQLKSLTSLVQQSTKMNFEAFLIIWLNGIAEHMSSRWSERIPPVIDLRSALIDGRILCALVAFYDEDFASEKKRTDLNYLRFFLNHHRGSTMTNLFPFTVKHLRENLIPDLNLQAMLIDLFVLFENGDENHHPSNLTYSINDEEEEEEEDEENDDEEEQKPVQSSCSTPNKTTWQRQAASNHTTPLTSARTADDLHVNQEYLAVKMQLEMKKRAIERDKQRLESVRDNKRQTISQEAFKQLLQQKTRQTAILNNDNQQQQNNIRKSQTTNEISRPKNENSIVDLSKPMSRDEFLNTLELLKKKYLESNHSAASPSPPPLAEATAHNNDSPSPTRDDSARLEELNSNIGELQQVLTSLSVKQEEIRLQVTQTNGADAPPVKVNGFVMELVDDPSASTAVEMERKKEIVFQRQQQRLEAFEQRRQRREKENNQRDDERRKKDCEESTKKLEREQRRDEIYRQYLMKKEKRSDGTNLDEHPTIKVRAKTAGPKSLNERKETILIAPFGTEPDINLNETQSLSFVRMAELRPTKPTAKIDSRTLTRPSARSATNETTPSLPLIPISEPRYPLAKPLSGKSNKQTIINALTQVNLAGRVNDRQREQVCDEIEKHSDKIKHFMILFRDSRLQYRSVYAFIPSTADTPPRLERLIGQGPKEITESMVDIFYKYNNGSKQFSQLPIKSFSLQCDAIAISNHYWSQSSATTTMTSTKRTNSTHFNATTTTSDSNQS
jgi:hypothetical protein